MSVPHKTPKLPLNALPPSPKVTEASPDDLASVKGAAMIGEAQADVAPSYESLYSHIREMAQLLLIQSFNAVGKLPVDKLAGTLTSLSKSLSMLHRTQLDASRASLIDAKLEALSDSELEALLSDPNALQELLKAQ